MKRKSSIVVLGLIVPSLVLAAGISRDLSFGSRGDDVKELQGFLAKDKTLYPEGLVTGFFGKLTRQAVVRFQKHEGISPAVGYVGPKTRAKLDSQMGTQATAMDDSFTEQFKALERTLADLGKATATTTAATSTKDKTAPQFIEGPQAVVSKPDLNSSPFGITAPSMVAISWKTNEPSAPVSFSCSPALAVSGLGLQATYWAETGGIHTCSLTIQDPAENRATTSFSFMVPGWTAITGTSSLPYAESIKLGDLELNNDSATTSLVFHVLVDVEDAADAPNSRGKNFKLLLRGGPLTSDATLTKLNVYMHSQYPGVGNMNKQSVSLYAGKYLAPGETRTFGLWAEGLTGPFGGGFLRFRVTGVTAIPEQTSLGSAVYTLSR